MLADPHGVITSFSQRGQCGLQLRQGLGRVGGLGGAAAAARLEAIGVDPTRRPETLGLDEWQRVYETFSA